MTPLPFLDLGATWLIVALAVLLRVGAAMTFLPLLGAQQVPLRARLAAMLALTAFLAPGVADGLPALPGPGDTLRLLAREILVGIYLGFMVRFCFFALEIFAAIAANSTSLSQMFAGAAAEPAPAIGHVHTLAFTAAATFAGLHVLIVRAFLESYEVFPLDGAGSLRAQGWAILASVSKMFEAAFTLAAPYVALSLLYNFTIGAVNKIVPHLMVTVIGAPALSLAGLVLLVIALPFTWSVWLPMLGTFAQLPVGAMP